MNEKILSQRILQLKESVIMKMAQYSRDLKRQGINIINLGIGEPDFNTPDRIKEKAIQAIENNITHYPPVNGFFDLRTAIIEKLQRDNGLSYDIDQIVVSNGAKQSLANVFLSVLNPGDEVIVPAPYWVSYPDMIRLAQGKLIPLKTDISNNFKVKPEQIESAITGKTKIFLINSPTNPTGSVYSLKELSSFAEVFKKYSDLLIISDEIYEHINYSGKHQSIASFKDIKDRVVVINGVSKAFAMTGWRIGYMAAPSWLASACSKLQGQVTSGPCSISQMAALEAMKIVPGESEFLKKMVTTFRERRDLVINQLQQIPGLQINIPEGAFYLFPNISYYFGKSDGKNTIQNSVDLCLYLLHKAHVALVPGESFGEPSYVRISYAADEEQIIKALYRIKSALSRLY